MGRYFVVREFWKHGDVDAGELLGAYLTEAEAQARRAESRSIQDRSTNGAYDETTQRIVHGAAVAQEPDAVRMALASLEPDDLASAVAAVLSGAALPLRLREAGRALSLLAGHAPAAEGGDPIAPHQAEGAAAMLARLVVAVAWKSGIDAAALAGVTADVEVTLLAEAARALQAQGVQLSTGVFDCADAQAAPALCANPTAARSA
ncbi:MAG: hypothetical protein FJ100_09190 [Deltaproteobacteria bacterium]|nr:hypothetical protein [Deltaproteobacteria bacterium]